MIVLLINLVFDAVTIFLIIRIILSWLTHNRNHPIIDIIYKITEPKLKPFRNMIEPIQGIDISPIIVFILLSFLKNITKYYF